jgi:hypothetical protein
MDHSRAVVLELRGAIGNAPGLVEAYKRRQKDLEADAAKAAASARRRRELPSESDHEPDVLDIFYEDGADETLIFG